MPCESARLSGDIAKSSANPVGFGGDRAKPRAELLPVSSVSTPPRADALLPCRDPTGHPRQLHP
jgi:hypothetical protein